MKKILYLLFSVMLIAFSSCKKDNSGNDLFVQEDSKTILKLKKQFKLDAFNIEATNEQSKKIVESAEANSKLFKVFKNNLNTTNIKLFTNNKDNITIAVFEFQDSKNKLFAVKGRLIKNSFLFDKEVLVGKGQNKNKEPISVISNGFDYFTITTKNKIDYYESNNQTPEDFKLIRTLNDCEGNHGGTGFCQLEKGEKFSTCYKAEKDEFCDGFFSCLAVDTNVSVMLVIAAACSCNATECPTK